jgi:hypothetical protein
VVVVLLDVSGSVVATVLGGLERAAVVFAATVLGSVVVGFVELVGGDAATVVVVLVLVLVVVGGTVVAVVVVVVVAVVGVGVGTTVVVVVVVGTVAAATVVVGVVDRAAVVAATVVDGLVRCSAGAAVVTAEGVVVEDFVADRGSVEVATGSCAGTTRGPAGVDAAGDAESLLELSEITTMPISDAPSTTQTTTGLQGCLPRPPGAAAVVLTPSACLVTGDPAATWFRVRTVLTSYTRSDQLYRGTSARCGRVASERRRRSQLPSVVIGSGLCSCGSRRRSPEHHGVRIERRLTGQPTERSIRNRDRTRAMS